MASWILVPCLVSLRNEFNQLSPGRDKASDGAIGDVAHQQEASDHNPDETGRTPTSDADDVNEVHAIDVDNDLNKPGWDMTRCVEVIVTRHRTGADDRLQNVIWNRRIWSRSWGWTARAYNGPSPHTEHAHFSARYTTAQEADTRPWGLLTTATLIEGDDDMDQKTFNTWLDAWWLARMAPTAADNPQRAALRVAPWQQVVGKGPKTTHEVLFSDMLALMRTAAGDEDVQQIITGVLTGLSPAQIAVMVTDALPKDLAKQTADELAARLAA